MTAYTVKVDSQGTRWFLNGQLHREDGPAVEKVSGGKWWFKHGKQHREDGPAVILPNGSRQWCLNGELHREDGPAYECVNGDKEWYLEGEEISEAEHRVRTSAVKELTISEIQNLLGYRIKIVE